MIPITPTNRIIYKNAQIRAFNFDMRTRRDPFYNAENVVIGDLLVTNHDGLISIPGTTTEVPGVFVKYKSIIEVSFNKGKSWPLSYMVDGFAGLQTTQQTIGERKIIGLINDTEQEIFNANDDNPEPLRLDTTVLLDYADVSTRGKIKDPAGSIVFDASEDNDWTPHESEITLVTQFIQGAVFASNINLNLLATQITNKASVYIITTNLSNVSQRVNIFFDCTSAYEGQRVTICLNSVNQCVAQIRAWNNNTSSAAASPCMAQIVVWENSMVPIQFVITKADYIPWQSNPMNPSNRLILVPI